MSDPSRLSPLAPAPVGAPGSTTRWSRLYGSARALAIANAAQNSAGPVLLLAADAQAAARFEAEFAFFAPELPRLALPDWETLPASVPTRTSPRSASRP